MSAYMRKIDGAMKDNMLKKASWTKRNLLNRITALKVIMPLLKQQDGKTFTKRIANAVNKELNVIADGYYVTLYNDSNKVQLHIGSNYKAVDSNLHFEAVQMTLVHKFGEWENEFNYKTMIEARHECNIDELFDYVVAIKQFERNIDKIIADYNDFIDSIKVQRDAFKIPYCVTDFFNMPNVY